MWAPLPLLMLLMAWMSGGAASGMIFPALLVGFVAWRAWRISRVSVSIHPTHLVIRNVLRTYSVPWAEVTQIGVHLSAPPEELIRAAIGLPVDEASGAEIPEHRRMLDETDGIVKLLVSIVVVRGEKTIFVDAVSVDLVEALAVAWKALRESHRNLSSAPISEWDRVISADELQTWFQQESPARPKD